MFIRALLLTTQFLLMSDRADFWDPDKESIDTEQMETPKSKQSLMDFRQFKGKNVLFLVHGFNNSSQDAIATYRQINTEMTTLSDNSGKPLYDVIIGYLWPGGDSRFEYFSAQRNSDALANRVGLHLNALAFFSDKLDILAHSMGNRLILGALDHLSLQNAKDETPISEKRAFEWNQRLLKASGSPKRCLIDAIKNRLFQKKNSKKPIRNYYSLAAAIDDESIEKNQKYYNATQECQNMYIFHSSGDEVLKFLFLLAERDAALGFRGAENILMASNNIQFIDCSSLVKDHSGYFAAASFYKFIRNQHVVPVSVSQAATNVRLLETGLIELLTQE